MTLDDARLAQLLDRATDQVAATGVAHRALREAGRRGRRRRVLTPVAVGAAAVLLVVAGVLAVGHRSPSGVQPAPAPDLQEVPSVPAATPLGDPAALDQDRSLNLPRSMTSSPVSGLAGGRVALLQVDGERPVVVWANGALEPRPDLAGRVFRHSLAPDGGAAALAVEDGFLVHSFYAQRSWRYPAPLPDAEGLWLGDSVAFTYDLPGEGAEYREHEPPFARDAVAFPLGDDLDQISLAPDGMALHEIDGGTYRRWANYADVALEADVGDLGELRGPVGGERWTAVVRDATGTDRDGVLLLDPLTGRPHRMLPVEAPVEDVVAHHWVGPDRLLLQAGEALVLWDVLTDELGRVSTLPAGARVSISDGDGSLVRR